MDRRWPAVLLAVAILAAACVDRSEEVDVESRVSELERAFREKPNDCRIAAELGAGYQHLYRYRDAVEYLGRSLELCPDDPTVQFQLGVCRYLLMEREAGLALMDQAIRRAREIGGDALADSFEQEKQAWLSKWDSIPELDWNKPRDNDSSR